MRRLGFALLAAMQPEVYVDRQCGFVEHGPVVDFGAASASARDDDPQTRKKPKGGNAKTYPESSLSGCKTDPASLAGGPTPP